MSIGYMASKVKLKLGGGEICDNARLFFGTSSGKIFVSKC